MDPRGVQHPGEETHESGPPPRSQRRQRHEVDSAHVEDRLRSLRDALRAARQGDFSVRLPTNGGEDGVLASDLAFNLLVEENDALVRELDRVARVGRRQGQITSPHVGPATGAWACASTRSTR